MTAPKLSLKTQPEPPKVFLEKTDFDAGPESWGGYEVEVTEKGGVTIYSECCADTMSRETAEKARDAIAAWLEHTAPKPVPKTQQEMADFARDWDAKVQAGREKRGEA